jgi:hypothetical protein
VAQQEDGQVRVGFEDEPDEGAGVLHHQRHVVDVAALALGPAVPALVETDYCEPAVRQHFRSHGVQARVEADCVEDDDHTPGFGCRAPVGLQLDGLLLLGRGQEREADLGEGGGLLEGSGRRLLSVDHEIGLLVPGELRKLLVGFGGLHFGLGWIRKICKFNGFIRVL